MTEIPAVLVENVPDPLPDDVSVLDVREPIEWHHGHIDGAIHIPLMDLPTRATDLPTDQQVLVVCKIGGRSAQAVGYLQQFGIDAVNLEGGMLDWAASGRAMVSETGEPAQVV